MPRRIKDLFFDSNLITSMFRTAFGIV